MRHRFHRMAGMGALVLRTARRHDRHGHAPMRPVLAARRREVGPRAGIGRQLGSRRWAGGRPWAVTPLQARQLRIRRAVVGAVSHPVVPANRSSASPRRSERRTVRGEGPDHRRTGSKAGRDLRALGTLARRGGRATGPKPSSSSSTCVPERGGSGDPPPRHIAGRAGKKESLFRDPRAAQETAKLSQRGDRSPCAKGPAGARRRHQASGDLAAHRRLAPPDQGGSGPALTGHSAGIARGDLDGGAGPCRSTEIDRH